MPTLRHGPDSRPALIDHFLSVLRDAQHDPQPATGFVAEVMGAEVNQQRTIRGRPGVDLDEVRQVEDRAAGRIDYTLKFAVGCADLVLTNPSPLSP